MSGAAFCFGAAAYVEVNCYFERIFPAIVMVLKTCRRAAPVAEAELARGRGPSSRREHCREVFAAGCEAMFVVVLPQPSLLAAVASWALALPVHLEGTRALPASAAAVAD
jgi:hypothetical protein